MASTSNISGISDSTRSQPWQSHVTSADTGETTTSRYCPPLTTLSTVMASPSSAVVHSVASMNCTITSPSPSVASSSSNHASTSYKRRSPIKLVSVEDHQNYCCGHWFPSNKSYTKHLAEKAKTDLVHEMRLIERGMVQCSECKTWLQMESLNAHLRKMHGIIKLGGKGVKGAGGPLPDTSRQQSKTMVDLLSEKKSVANTNVQNGLPGYVIKVNGKSLVKSFVSSNDKVKTVSSNNDMFKKLKINHGPGKRRLVIQGGTRKLSGNGIASRILMPSGQPSGGVSPIAVSRVGSPILSSDSVIAPAILTTSVPPMLGSGDGGESGSLEGNKIIYSGSLIRSENEDVNRVLTPSSYSSVKNSIIDLPENGMQVVKKKIVKTRKMSGGGSSESSLVNVSERKNESGKKNVSGGSGGSGAVGRPRKSRKQVLTPQNSTTESSVLNDSVSNLISPGFSDDNLSMRPGVMTSTPVTSRKRKKKKGKDGLDPNAPRYTKAGKLMKKRGRPRKNPLPPVIENVPEFDPDVENEPVVSGPAKEEEENIPTVELDLFTLPSANEESTVLFLTDPKNPNFKVYANTDAIFVGDSSAALGDVTNQIGYVTDTNNVVYVNPSHFLFPNVKDLENFVPYPILTAKGPKVMVKKTSVNAPSDSALSLPKNSIPSLCKDQLSVTNTTEPCLARDMVKSKTCDSSVSSSMDKKVDSSSSKLNESISEGPSHLPISSVGTNNNAIENRVIEEQVTASSLVENKDNLRSYLSKEGVEKHESVEHSQSSQNLYTVDTGLTSSEGQRTEESENVKDEEGKRKEKILSEEKVSDVHETLSPKVKESIGKTKSKKSKEFTSVDSEESESSSVSMDENKSAVSKGKRNKDRVKAHSESETDSDKSIVKVSGDKEMAKLKELRHSEKDELQAEIRTENGGVIECAENLSPKLSSPVFTRLRRGRSRSSHVDLDFNKPSSSSIVLRKRSRSLSATKKEVQENAKIQRGWESQASSSDGSVSVAKEQNIVCLESCRIDTPICEEQPTTHDSDTLLEEQPITHARDTHLEEQPTTLGSDALLEEQPATHGSDTLLEEQPTTHGSDTLLEEQPETAYGGDTIVEHSAVEEVSSSDKETHQVPSLKSLAGRVSREREVTVTEAATYTIEGSDELEACDTRSTSDTDVASDAEFNVADEEDIALMPSGKQRLSIRKLEDIQDLNISSIKGPFDEAEQSLESQVCMSSICGDEASDVSQAEAEATRDVYLEGGERRADTCPDAEQPPSSHSETDEAAPIVVSELETAPGRNQPDPEYSPPTDSVPSNSLVDVSEEADVVENIIPEVEVSSDRLPEPGTCGTRNHTADFPSEDSGSSQEIARNRPPANILKTRIEIPLNIANGLMTKGSLKKEGKKEKKKKKRSPKKDLEDHALQKSDKKRTKKRRKSSSPEKISVLEVHPLSPKQEVPRLKQMKIDKILLQREGKNVYKVAKSPEKKEADVAERSEVEGILARKCLDMDSRSHTALVENESNVPVKIKKKRLIQKFSKDKTSHKLSSEDSIVAAQSFRGVQAVGSPLHIPRSVRERRPSSRLIESIQNSRTNERTYSPQPASLVPHEMSPLCVTTAVGNEPQMQALAPGEVISVMRPGPVGGLAVHDVFTNSLKPQEDLPIQKRKRGRPRKRLEVVEFKVEDEVRKELEVSPTREWRGRGAKLKAQVLIQDQQAGVIDSQVVPVSPVASPGGSGSGSPGGSSIDQSLSPSKRESMEREWQARNAKLKAQVMITDQQQGVSDVKVFPCVSPAPVTQVPSLNIRVSPSPGLGPSHTPVPKKTKYDVTSPKNRDIRSFFVKKSPVSTNSEDGESSSLKLTLAHRVPSRNKRIRRYDYDSSPSSDTEAFPQRSYKKQEKVKRARNTVAKPVKRLKHSLFALKSPSRKSVKTVTELRDMLMDRERALNRAIPSAELFILTKDFDGFEMTSRQSGLRSKTLMRMMSLLQNKTYYNADRFAMPLECLFDWNDETLTKVLFPNTFMRYK